MRKTPITLTLEVVDLVEKEVNGISIQGQKIVKGVLDEELDWTVRYWLTRVGSKLKKEAKGFRDLRDDLIKKLGKEDPKEPGKWLIPRFIKDDNGNDIPNPSLKKFDTELDKIKAQEITFEANMFLFEEFNFKTGGDYSNFILNFVELEAPEEEAKKEEAPKADMKRSAGGRASRRNS